MHMLAVGDTHGRATNRDQKIEGSVTSQQLWHPGEHSGKTTWALLWNYFSIKRGHSTSQNSLDSIWYYYNQQKNTPLSQEFNQIDLDYCSYILLILAYRVYFCMIITIMTLWAWKLAHKTLKYYCRPIRPDCHSSSSVLFRVCPA